MSFVHLAIGSADVAATTDYLCRVMQWDRVSMPENIPLEVSWIDITPTRDRSQQIHVIHVDGFEVSPFEREFGRHLAVMHDGSDFPALKQRIEQYGGKLIDPIRPTPFGRFFFREPINGYLFEVIDRQAWSIE